jgi:hypothetical protein
MADVAITPSLVQNSDAATIISADTAVAITAGQLVAKDVNGKFILADADGVSPAHKVVGIAIDSAPGANQPLDVATADTAFVPGGTLVVGTAYILSATPGGLAPYADGVTGMNRQIIGVAVTTTTLLLRIIQSNTLIP